MQSKRYATLAAVALTAALTLGVATSASAAPPTRIPVPGPEYGSSAVSVGMGGASRAYSIGPAALYSNPAGIAQGRMYAIELGYAYADFYDGHGFHAAITDSKMNPHVAAGLGYTYFNASDEEGHAIRFGLASGYRSQEFSALLGADLNWVTANLLGDPLGNQTGSYEKLQADVGLMLDFMGMMTIGIVGHNLVVAEESIAPEMPTGLGIGLAFRYSGMTVTLDSLIDFTSKEDAFATYAVGAEYFVAGMVAVRMGYQRSGYDETNRISGGLGYVSALWGLDVSYQHNVDTTGDMLLSTSVRFYLP